MLPRGLYELLPYLYIFTGIICAVLIDSTIVIISSLLLIITGIFVFIMRRNFRKTMNEAYRLHQEAYEAEIRNSQEQRSGVERRSRKVTEWPIRDDAGDEILAERRSGQRRISA